MGRAGAGTSTQEYPEIGERLRTARQARGLSLRALAELLSVSPSLISQVETGRARPSVSTLYAMASELDISLDELLFPDTRSQAATARMRPDPAPSRRGYAGLPPEPVQRASTRKMIRLASGVVWERLTTASMPNVDFLFVTYEVGGASSPEHEFQRHGGQEWGYILDGRLGVTVGFDSFVLDPGDSIALDSSLPHRLYAIGDVPAHAIWFVLGRSPVNAGVGVPTEEPSGGARSAADD